MNRVEQLLRDLNTIIDMLDVHARRPRELRRSRKQMKQVISHLNGEDDWTKNLTKRMIQLAAILVTLMSIIGVLV